MQTNIPAASLEFLNTLSKHNNRDWFNEHKRDFLEQQAAVAHFAEALLAKLNIHDIIETPSGKKSLQRIYRDTRFSKEKTPYKTNWSGHFSRSGKERRGGYYFHIEPGNSFIAGGFWGPEAQDLKRVRDEIAFDAAPLNKILAENTFKDTFGTLQGDQLKTSPKGFDNTHPAIDLLRYKQFLLIRKFTDAAVLKHTFLAEANQTYKNMRPFFDYMSEILSTDVNGISTI